MRPPLRSCWFQSKLLLIVVITCGPANGHTWRVPADAPTIQAGLDSLSANDTLRIEPGTYEEALYAPLIAFVMIGNIDSTEEDRPVIDPSGIPGSDTLSCMSFDSSGRVVLRALRFVNRSPMLNNRNWTASQPGGIMVERGAIVIEHCRFDSTYIGIHNREGSIYLDSCHFLDNYFTAVRGRFVKVIAAGCVFSAHGDATQAVIYAGPDSELRGCRIRHDGDAPLLGGGGGRFLIENCDFGPCGPTVITPIDLNCDRSLTVRGSAFLNCQYLGTPLFNVDLMGDSILTNPIQVEQCRFVNCTATAGSEGGLLSVHRESGSPTRFVTVEWNDFANCTSRLGADANVLYSELPGVLTHNRIVQCTPAEAPDVFFEITGPDTPQVHDNLFEQSGIAVSATDVVNARFNWWGDPSGPFNPLNNPNGLGGEVGDSVLFDPWYSDTTFTSPGHSPHETPSTLALAAFPNPFNSSVEFRMTVPTAAWYRVDFYDVLGRATSHTWQGWITDRSTVRFECRDLVSGVYFARVSDSASRNSTTAKLLLIR